MTIMVIMRNAAKTSVVEAKAHFSELVYRAERKGCSTTIYRRGRAVAVIAPVGSVREEPRRAPAEALAHFESMVGHAPVATESIRESMGRSRCD